MVGALLAVVAALVPPGSHVFELATYPFAARGYVGSGSSIRPIDPVTSAASAWTTTGSPVTV